VVHSLYIVCLCRYRVTVTKDGGSFEQTVMFRTRGASMLYVVWPVRIAFSSLHVRSSLLPKAPLLGVF